MASDGMWDVIKTPEAHKMTKNLSAAKAASKLSQVSTTVILLSPCSLLPRALEDSLHSNCMAKGFRDLLYPRCC